MIIPVVAVGFVLAVARVVKNLPKDAMKNFFDHRTKVNEIIARDTKGRVAAVQKQRLVFMGFMLVCVVVVALAVVASRSSEVTAPLPEPQQASSPTSQASK
ncbi:hypothetical protein OG496_31685 [Streptomyces sp. NBC_00988]|uniref:hypothetical protein n=1 Tax=Streptomyces sp. NBC_00988 TaxID=2903704 RepID=UPI00386E807B|nr:hypothetical protein OG496_31685 [Streptomyces sp. NBC_00988]